MIVWVRLYFKPSGLRCEMTVTPLEWVLGRDSQSWMKIIPHDTEHSIDLVPLSSYLHIQDNLITYPGSIIQKTPGFITNTSHAPIIFFGGRRQNRFIISVCMIFFDNRVVGGLFLSLLSLLYKNRASHGYQNTILYLSLRPWNSTAHGWWYWPHYV